MALRDILVSFGFDVDTKPIEKGEKGVESLLEKVQNFGKLAAGAFVAKEVVEFGKALLEEGDALAKQSQALGVATKELQGWQWAAALSGSSAEEFSAAFTKFTRNVNEASEAAGGPAAKALKELGVTIKDASGNIGAPIDLLDGVVAGLEKIEDPAKRTALVMDLFGKSGARLLPLFSEGAEGLAKLRAEVDELGFGFDESFLEDAQEINDNIDRLHKGFRGLAIQAIGPLLPWLVRGTEKLVELTKQFVAVVKHGELVKTALITVALKGVLTLSDKVGGLGVALRSLTATAFKTLVPFYALEDLLVFLGGGKSVIGDALDSAFGDGSADKVRAWTETVRKDVVAFFSGLSTSPQHFIDDMETLFQGLRSKKFWQFVFGDNALADWAQFWTDLVLEPGELAKKFSKGLSNFFFDSEEQREKAGVPQQGLPEGERGAVKSTLDVIPGLTELRNRVGPARALNEEARVKQGLPPSAALVDPAMRPQVRGESTSFLDQIGWLKALRDTRGPGAQIDQDLRRSVAPVVQAPAAAPVTNVEHNVTNAQQVHVTVPAAASAEQQGRVIGRGVLKELNNDMNDAAFAALVSRGGS